MEESWRRRWKVVRKWNVIVWKGDSFFFFFCLLAPLDSVSDPLGLKQILRILPTLILPAYRSTMLMACVFVTRDTVRHLRRFVFGKFVRKPNCSWSEAFVNQGLIVYVILWETLLENGHLEDEVRRKTWEFENCMSCGMCRHFYQLLVEAGRFSLSLSSLHCVTLWT